MEAEPWGYAPFHYGRWAHIGPVWAWVPGPIVVRPVYAPALVAFVGGPGFGMGIGVGVQAWFPLGPRELFIPWYHHGPNYIREVNVVNVTNVTNIHYVNREVAVTAVSGEAFRGGQPVTGGLVHVLRNSSPTRRSSPIRRLTPRHGRFSGQGQWRPAGSRGKVWSHKGCVTWGARRAANPYPCHA